MDRQYEYREFESLVAAVEAILEKEWQNAEEFEKQGKLEKEKKAIMGFSEEIEFYKKKIHKILKKSADWKSVIVPPWYKSAEDGIFAEIYGFSGLTPWIYDEKEEYMNSSSAKLIGDRMYCLIDGKSVLQPQRISKERRNQLKRALLLATPQERLEKGFHEIYLINGIRITIFSGERTKEDQDVMVFRKYVLKELTFEKMALMGTIPSDAVELFKTMVRLGFNVLFSGQVRAGKTAFMQTWQRYEDPSLEGMAIATDPETPWHRMMPEAPIMQVVADGEDLKIVSKSMLRGDNDYILIEEMRDAYAFRLALDITSMGTRRSKATIHAGDPLDIPYKMASSIVSKFGGDFRSVVAQIFRNFNFVFEFYQVPGNRAVKRLKSISEYRYDPEKDSVSIHTICMYDESEKKWMWKRDIGEDKKKMGSLQPEEFKRMNEMLGMLEKRSPIAENTVIYPRYYGVKRGDEKFDR